MSAQGLPGPEATCLSMLQWWKWANSPVQTLLFTVPRNRLFAMEKFLIVPKGTGHKLHNTKKSSEDSLLTCVHVLLQAQGYVPCPRSHPTFSQGCCLKVAFLLELFSGYKYRKSSCFMRRHFSLRSTTTSISIMLFLTLPCCAKNLKIE